MASVVLQQTTNASQFVANTTGQPVGVPSASVLSADYLEVSSVETPVVNATTVNATTVNGTQIFGSTVNSLTYAVGSQTSGAQRYTISGSASTQTLTGTLLANTTGTIPIPSARTFQTVAPVVNGGTGGYDIAVRDSVQSLPLEWSAPYQGIAGAIPVGLTVTVPTVAVTANSKIRLMLVGTSAAAYAAIVAPHNRYYRWRSFYYYGHRRCYLRLGTSPRLKSYSPLMEHIATIQTHYSLPVFPQQNNVTMLNSTITTTPVMLNYSVNSHPNANSLLSSDEKSGIPAVLRPQSPSVLFEPFPYATKSESLHTLPYRNDANAPLGLLSEVCVNCRR